MSRRQNYSIPGIKHVANPIPMAARVGSLFQTSAIPGRDPATNAVPEDGSKEIEFAFANARALLDVAEVEADQVVYVEILLADNALRGDVNKHWLDWFPDDDDRPARHTTVRELPNGMKIQLLVRAQLDPGHG
jgi:2-iminobutanoate/2-iminopropanoate deaminase